MNSRYSCLMALVFPVFFASCTSHYALTSVERSRIVIDKRYDANPDAKAVAFLAPFKHIVDSVAGPAVGIAAKDLTVYRPESPLSNLLADIMVWGGKTFNETPDFGVYNMGGARASISAGSVTYGDVVNVAPFENKICFLTLTGNDVMELFSQIAKRKGEGVSHSVRLVITKDGQLKSATINGKKIDPTANYRVATIDYLAQGNDGMPAFKMGKDVLAPKESINDSRYIITNYFKEKTSEGLAVDANVEGRITIE